MLVIPEMGQQPRATGEIPMPDLPKKRMSVGCMMVGG
jgi:hypothetical protein